MKIKKISYKGLDLVNFFLADVRDGIGAYLGIFLLSSHNWSLSDIGIVTSVMAFSSVLAQTPAGAIIDSTKNKKFIIGLASFIIGLGTLVIIINPSFITVFSSQLFVGIAAAFIAPSINGITLGLTGYKKFNERIGRNEAFNHGGNMVFAITSGAIGYFVGIEGIFVLTFVLALASIGSLFLIKNNHINHNLSRGQVKINKTEYSKEDFSALKHKSFILLILSCVLFHLANAAMMPLAGQYIVAENEGNASVFMSACIIIAQLVMIPVSAIAGKKADIWGRKPIFLVAFIALPIRALLYTFSSNPYYVTSVQILDGIAAGIFGVIAVLMISDLTKGSGHFNLATSILATSVGIGAALSNLGAGYIAELYSIPTAYLVLSGVAFLGLILFYFTVKETNSHTNNLSI